MRFFAPIRPRVKKDVVVRIHRRLKGIGELYVSRNQYVSPSDILGTALVSSGFRIIKLAESLSVAPTEVEKYMKRRLGERIYKDELLAQRERGLFGGKINVIASTDGILDFLNPKTGELRMTFLPKKQDLPAGVFGIVDDVDNSRGLVTIRTQVSIVYGKFGSGRVRDGILHIISKRDELVGKSIISPKLDGQILVGGSLVFGEAISSVISAGVSGIITGGINAKDYRGMARGRLIFPKKLDNDIGISVVVCEGFGAIPIGDDIYDILKEYDGKFATIDGNANVINLPSFDSNSINKVKSTHLPPIQDENLISLEKLDQMIDLELGFKVRVVGNYFAGEQGYVVALDKTETSLASGIKTFLTTIETRRRKIQIPVANLEVIS